MKIDAHQHFWKYDPVRDKWIDNTMEILQKDFMPKDLQSILTRNSIDGCVSVQADQSEKETEFLLELANQNNFIKGVVGWVDLISDQLKDRLSYFSQNTFFKGVRHIAQGEEDDYLSRKDVVQGISTLTSYELTYDILVYAHQLPSAIELVKQIPYQKFVLDHIAKPKISQGLDEQWVSNIKKLADHPNVYCKLSGMLTETAEFKYNPADFRPFLDVICKEFGMDRIMYGSDWPVCLLAAQYKEQLSIIQDYIADLSSTEQAKIMGENAIKFYNLME